MGKQIIKILILLVISIFPLFIQAEVNYPLFNQLAESSQSASEVKIENPLQWNSFAELLEKIAVFLFKISLPVGSLMIMIAAFYFLTSAGNPEKIEKAKNIIIWALVGIIVLYLSLAIGNLINNVLKSKKESYLFISLSERLNNSYNIQNKKVDSC